MPFFGEEGTISRFLGIKQSLFLLFDKIRQNKTISDNISHSVTVHYIVKLVWKKLCIYDIMILGAKQFVPRTKRDVYIRRHPNGGPIMKKQLAIIAMIVLLCTALILCACDDTDNVGDGDGNNLPAACSCPNCNMGVCSCGQCYRQDNIPSEIKRAQLLVGGSTTYFSESNSLEYSTTSYFVFKPKYTSDYTLTWDKKVLEFKINGTPTEIDWERKVTTQRFVGGQEYEIDASMGTFTLSDYPLTMTIEAETYNAEISLNKDEDYLVKMPQYAYQMQIKTISFGENVLIKNVFKKNDNYFSDVVYNRRVSNKLDLDVGYKEYYFVICASENVVTNYNEADANIQKVYVDQKIELAMKANVVYYFIFANDYARPGDSTTGWSYMNIYDTATDSGRARNMELTVYRDWNNGSIVQISRFARRSYYEFSVLQGEYYFTLVTYDVDKTITFEIGEKMSIDYD